MAMRRHRHCLDATKVPLATAPIFAGIRVEYFTPQTRPGHPDPVVLARNGCEVTCHNNHRVAICALSHKGEGALLPIICLRPLEPGRVGIETMECGLRAIEAVQVADQALNARV